MKLIVCSKDIDSTLIQGDLISWHNDADILGRSEGMHNALKYGIKPDAASYQADLPFIILHLPNITIDDLGPFIGVGSGRPVKINFAPLENRAPNSYFPADDTSPDKLYWEQVIAGPIRRDTLTAYNEITRTDINFAGIVVPR